MRKGKKKDEIRLKQAAYGFGLEEKMRKLKINLDRGNKEFEKINILDTVTVSNTSRNRQSEVTGTVIFKDSHKFILEKSPWDRITYLKNDVISRNISLEVVV